MYHYFIQIIEPSKSINMIYDELLLYKTCYDKVIKQVKKIRKHQYDKDSIIDNLRNELMRVKEEYKNSICSNLNNSNLTKFNNPLIAGMKFFNISMAEKYTTDEWIDIMKFTNLTLQQLQQLSKDPLYSIIIDCIELMNRAVLDKNMHIQILTLENENLNKKNTALFEENVLLSRKLIQQKLDQTKDQSSTALHTNASMVILVKNSILTLVVRTKTNQKKISNSYTKNVQYKKLRK